MQLYYFDIVDGALSSDREGTELANHHAAWDHAIAMAETYLRAGEARQCRPVFITIVSDLDGVLGKVHSELT